MTQPNQNLLRRGRWLVRLGAHLIDEIYRGAIAPTLLFWWHSSLDLFALMRANPVQPDWRRLLAPLLWLERRIPPSRGQPRLPLKLVLLLLVVFGARSLLGSGTTLEDLQKDGELVVVSRESETTLMRDGEVTRGPVYDYLKSFAEFLGVDLRLDLRDNSHAVNDAIARDEGHIGAAGMTYHPPLRDRGLLLGPGYQDVDIQVVCRRNHGKRPRSVDELDEIELVVVADSPYETRLFELQQEYPDLTWESDEAADVDDLLELVWRKEIGCTIANSSEIGIKRRFYPELVVAFTIKENDSLVWTLSPEWEILADSIEQWLELIEQDGTLMILRDRHYREQDFDYVDMRTFIRRIRSRLPRLEPLFRKYADQHNIPWTLLAAQSYQESHWNRRAKSPTGVRGIMMLTLTTAREMGVDSRLDVEQSIMGGAKYLRRLERRIPDTVQGEDRWWYALAAYNVGMGHVHDARRLARELDLDPDNWRDLRGVLPLLAQKKYYQHLKYGRARGSEPVDYVQRIRNYRTILHAQLVRERGVHGG